MTQVLRQETRAAARPTAAYLLKRALLDLDELQREVLGPLGINSRELAVLLLLQAREPESKQQAATRLRVDRTTMVGMLDALRRRACWHDKPPARTAGAMLWR